MLGQQITGVKLSSLTLQVRALVCKNERYATTDCAPLSSTLQLHTHLHPDTMIARQVHEVIALQQLVCELRKADAALGLHA
jgi:DMSO/TMAO reductase YedYZ molybdopterin-dependent catalytic subunit